VGGTQLDSDTETGSVAGTLVDSEEDEVITPPGVPLVLPHTMDIHARVEGDTFAVYSDSSFDNRILSLSRNQTLVLFTDGSHDAREGKAGWGAVAVHRDGGLKGPLEDEGDSKRVLRGPVVTNPCQAGYLQNTLQKLTNSTAELSAVAEAILYLLELLREGGRDAGRVKLVVIRSDSTYAENAVRGRTRPNENRLMVYEIRRHYADLQQRLRALNIHLAWSHVSAHVGKRWNEFADNTAKEGANGTRPVSRSSFRNPQLGGPIVDTLDEDVAGDDYESDSGTDVAAVSRQDPPRPVPPAAAPRDAPPADVWQRPQDNTPLLDIPMSDLGVLCGLAPTTNHVRHKWPNAIRRCYLFLFGQLMQGDNIIRNTLLWKKILLLQRVLFTPLAPNVNWSFWSRCQCVLHDDWSHFTLGAFKKRHSSPPGGRSAEQHTKTKLSRSRALMEAGEISRSFRCLQSEYVELRSPEELREAYLRKLAERSAECDIPTASGDVPDIVISVQTAAKVVKEAGKCISNCPITSLRFEVFQALIGKSTTPDEVDFLSHLTAFFNAIAQNKVPPEVAPLLTGTQGLVIPKQDNKDRPLGLREGITNLAIKCALRTARPKTTRIFSGKNYALAGSNKLSELIALSSNHLRVSPEHDNIFIDLPNAFNECSREVAAREIIRRCPELLRSYELLYRDASHIWLRDGNDDWQSSLASEGCVQGCVMGPFVFGFATISLYESVMSTLEGKEHAFFGAFSDDSMIGAAHDDALVAFDTFKREAEAIRLKINFNRNKTVVMIGRCGSQVELDRRVQAYQERGFPEANILVHPDDGGDPLLYGYKHLGVPVGSRQYCSSALDALIEKFAATCECDDAVDSVQQKWVYLLWVIRHKFPFWFRHMCPSITLDKLPAIKAVLQSKFSAIAGFELDVTESVWRQVCLPIKSHGCGLGDPLDVTTAAFVAHVDETIDVVRQHFPNAAYLDLLHSDDIADDHEFGSPDIEQFVLGYRRLKRRILDSQASLGQEYDEEHAEMMVAKKKAQHFYFTSLSEHAVKEYEDEVMRTGSLHDRARTFSNDGSFAGAWLHGIPKKDNRHLDNVSFRRALMLRLGVPFSDKPLRCKCKNRAIIDSHLDHILSCSQFSAERKHRHDAIVQDIKSMCNHAGLQFTDPRLGEFRTPTHNDNKAADGCIRGLRSKPLNIDVTVWNPTGVNALRRGSGALQHQTIFHAEKMKTDKYEERCREIDHYFMPMAIEIYGAASKQVESFIDEVVKKAAEVNVIPHAILLSYWRKRISTTLQFYNARLISQAYLQLNDNGGGNMYRDFALERVG
jgi:ribonuclease HI